MNTTEKLNWSRLLEDFKASGQNARSFAKQNNLNYHTLRYHLKKGAVGHSDVKGERIVPIPMNTSVGSGMNSGREIRITFEEAGSVTIRITGL